MKLRHERCANRMNKELCPALRLGLDPGTVPCAGCENFEEGEPPEAQGITVGEAMRRTDLVFDGAREMPGVHVTHTIILLALQCMTREALKTGELPETLKQEGAAKE